MARAVRVVPNLLVVYGDAIGRNGGTRCGEMRARCGACAAATRLRSVPGRRVRSRHKKLAAEIESLSAAVAGYKADRAEPRLGRGRAMSNPESTRR